MPLYFKNLYWRVLLFIFYQGYRICMCLTWGFLIFVIIHAIPQLFGNSHGFGNSMEHNIVGGGCLLCLHTVFTDSTKAHNDNLFWRHGTCNLFLRLTRPHCYCYHTALRILFLYFRFCHICH